MNTDILPHHVRVSLEKHARLFELLRQNNLVATSRIGRKARPVDEVSAALFLAAADASFA
jgi:adenosine deaminase